MASSSRLGLGARQLLTVGTTGPRRTTPLFSNGACLVQSKSPFTTSQSRPRVGPSRQALEQSSTRTSSQSSPSMEMAHRMRMGEIGADALSMVVPGTFILPPVSQFPKPLGDKLRFLGAWLVIKGQEMLTNTMIKFSSKPTFFARAQFKPKKELLIPTAKALHRSMAEALATGDKSTINKICSRHLASRLVATIDARPRGRRYGWELIGYTNKLLYPSIRSHKMAPVSRDRYAPVIRQVVVAISSKQRKVAYDGRGQVVPGSEKEVEAVENVVMACILNQKTWQSGEWRLIGTVSPTTYEGWLKEKAALKVMLQEP